MAVPYADCEGFAAAVPRLTRRCTSPSVSIKSISRQYGGSAKTTVPRPLAFGEMKIVESNSFALSSTAGGALASSYSVAPAGIILAARLAGYQALRDECRIDRVMAHLLPIQGTGASGQVCMYIERNIADAPVATFALANDQQEKVAGHVSRPLTLNWLPREPADHEFNLLNPGTVSLAEFQIVASGLTASTAYYTLQLVFYATLRGRP